MRSLSATPVAAGMKIDEFDRSEFWARVDNQDSIRPCWEWRGLISEGRPRFTLQGKRVLAHRAAYLLAYGIDPGSMLVLHACDNDLCVNPRHLRLGTQTENAADRSVAVQILRMFAAMRDAGKVSGVERARRAGQISMARAITSRVARGFVFVGRSHRPDRGRRRDVGQLNAKAKITDAIATEIRAAFWGGVERQSEISDRLGVAYHHVANVVRRKCFAHLPLADGEPPYEQVAAAVKARTVLVRGARESIKRARAASAPKPISRRTGRASLPVIRDGEVARDASGNVVTLGQLGRTRRRKSPQIGAAA